MALDEASTSAELVEVGSHGRGRWAPCCWAPPPPDPWGLPPLGFDGILAAAQDRREGAERAAAATAEQLGAEHSGLVVHTMTPEARPDDGLVEAAEMAGIVVLGSRGHGMLSGMVLGSTSRSVLHHTRTPVMIVH